MHEPFATIEDAQAAVDAWRKEYNADRPHQSLAMAFPAARFVPASRDVLGVRVPAQLAVPVTADHADDRAPAGTGAPRPTAGDAVPKPGQAVELDRVVPPSGNLRLAGQQIWLGPALAGRTIRLWAGLDRVHVLQDGHRIKTLPSRLDARDLTRLAEAGGAPAGPPPLPPASDGIIEIDRTVTASGNISVGSDVMSAGLPLAGRRVTLRLDGPVAHIVSDGTLARAVACPIPEHARSRGPGTAGPPRLPQAQLVRRRVSVRDAIMIGGQRIQVGLPHVGKTADVTIGTDTYQIAVEDGTTITVPRTTSHDIKRHKASNYPPART